HLSDPNHARRYLAMERLRALGAEAEPALRRLWESGAPAERARALWLLAELPQAGDRYLGEALGHPDADLRVAALRVARRTGRDLLPLVQPLATDPSVAVRREAALSLRDLEASAAAPVWAELAARHDGA